MKTSEIKCEKCGDTPIKAADKGAYLKRTSPKGQHFVGECMPFCDRNNGDQNDALIESIQT